MKHGHLSAASRPGRLESCSSRTIASPSPPAPASSPVNCTCRTQPAAARSAAVAGRRMPFPRDPGSDQGLAGAGAGTHVHRDSKDAKAEGRQAEQRPGEGAAERRTRKGQNGQKAAPSSRGCRCTPHLCRTAARRRRPWARTAGGLCRRGRAAFSTPAAGRGLAAPSPPRPVAESLHVSLHRGRAADVMYQNMCQHNKLHCTDISEQWPGCSGVHVVVYQHVWPCTQVSTNVCMVQWRHTHTRL